MKTAPNSPLLNNRYKKLADLFLIILIITGLFFRFNWVNWSQGTNLHPDEYGLTNTLTRLSIPKSLDEYFNTRISPISPYAKYDINGQKSADGPDNRMRWGQLPIILIRQAGELTGNTGYNEIRLLGRTLSALADSLTLLLIFLIGRKLYSSRVGLLATALSSLAVMQIQQSHFMTVDNFGGFFTTLALYACVQIAAHPLVNQTAPRGQRPGFSINKNTLSWYLLFGFAFGMALACKINLLPVGGLVLVGAFISAVNLKQKAIFSTQKVVLFTLGLLAISFFAAGITFRLAQPMTFRANSGDTGFFTLSPNPDWVESMKVASAESSGEGGGPPGEQWAHRPAFLFPLVNMVVWGMGLPLGLAGWLSLAVAAWQVIYRGTNWRKHLIPLIWTGGYFLFMGSRWVKSVRYFLPIYPFLSLFAAWGIWQLWVWAKNNPGSHRVNWRAWLSTALASLTLIGTLAWAISFVQAVYLTDHTRIQATQWIFQNIPGPFQLNLQKADGSPYNKSIEAPDNLRISSNQPYTAEFTLSASGLLQKITIPHTWSQNPSSLNLVISTDRAGLQPLAQTTVNINPTESQVTGQFASVPLDKDHTYFLTASVSNPDSVFVARNLISNESWDEGLPVPFENINPFGQYYSGHTMQIRWFDNTKKRNEMLSTLEAADYLIMPSQRAVWSICRIPKTYPMTMKYYRALFNGKLGFDLIATFSSPLKFGPLEISDVGGTIAWNKSPHLPLFNGSWLAAEEAFSVYDHPPVWVFKKRPDFNLAQVRTILRSVDLDQVVPQTALNADGDWCPSN